MNPLRRVTLLLLLLVFIVVPYMGCLLSPTAGFEVQIFIDNQSKSSVTVNLSGRDDQTGAFDASHSVEPNKQRIWHIYASEASQLLIEATAKKKSASATVQVNSNPTRVDIDVIDASGKDPFISIH